MRRGGPVVKRPLGALGLAACVAAFAALSAGITLGFLSATSSLDSNAAAAGIVSLTTCVSGTCTVAGALPGSAPAPCVLAATYTGSVTAYLGVDVLIETQAGSGGMALFNPADPSHDLQIVISSTSPSVASYQVPSVATSCPASAPTGSTCYGLNDELVSTGAFTSSSPTVTFSTTVSVPTTSTTGYQGGAAQVITTVHAVQALHNGSTATCNVGFPCAAVTWQ
jgi:hypothetical protein